jgi:NAD(P)-dependent dehydrogenase (short-subunit alcohol dehydrogenase family)
LVTGEGVSPPVDPLAAVHPAAPPLAGRTVLVTGANRGIGRAFADEAIARGARVYATARDVVSLDTARAQHGDRLVALQLDLTDPNSVAALARACPDLDLVIHNAGAVVPGPVLAVPDGELRGLFETNFFGPVALLRQLSGGLARRRGGLLVVSSLAALMLSRSSPAYSASKAALTMAVFGLRTALRDSGVQVSVVYPGFVATDMTSAMTVPKAPARSVAARALDAFAAGELAIFPDRYAELVYDAVQHEVPKLLRDPQAVADAVVQRFAVDPAAGT